MKGYFFKLISVFLAIMLACSAVMSAVADDKSSGFYDTRTIHLKGCGVTDYSLDLSCEYSDSYFYIDNTIYNPRLSMLTLEMAMSAFTCPEYIHGDDSYTPEYNAVYSYKQLGFENAKFYNYEISLTDKSDKVAYSFATKEIINQEGNPDTLVAVIIRGGNYGGEWVSNFHAYGDDDPLYTSEHYGFKTAAKDVFDSFDEFLKKNGELLKGNVKLWTTGYSRGAAVCNMFSHLVNTAKSSTFVSKYIDRSNVYSYQFACPCGTRDARLDNEADQNIFVISSPCDLVPMIPFPQWGFAANGNIINLPDEMDEVAQSYFDYLLKGTEYCGHAPCSPKQADTFQRITDKISEALTEGAYKGLQSTIMKLVGKSYNSEDEISSSGGITSNKALIAAISFIVKSRTGFDLEENFNGIVYGHLPEHYLSLIYSSIEGSEIIEPTSDLEKGTDTETESDTLFTDSQTESDAADTTTESDDSDNSDVTIITDTDSSDTENPLLKLTGDVTLDGDISMEDVVLLQRYIARLVNFMDEQEDNADVNSDGDVNMLDVTRIQYYLAGLIDRF